MKFYCQNCEKDQAFDTRTTMKGKETHTYVACRGCNIVVDSELHPVFGELNFKKRKRARAENRVEMEGTK